MDYETLWNEINTDPLERGYAEMTDLEIAADLNTEYREVLAETLSSSQLYEALSISEYASLATDEKEHIRVMLGLGEGIDVSDGSKARARLLDFFGTSSDTIQALIDALTQTVSRASELGLSRVYEHHIETARERYGG